MCVGCAHSPQSLTGVSSWEFAPLPPSCNSNYLGYSSYNYSIVANFELCLFTIFIYGLAVLCQVCFQIFGIFQNSACSNLLLISRINKKAIFFVCFN
ncbi:hypothetical protein DS259_13200 [Salmonella enterica subsp. indica]|nr:hypothetical protein [Salmonella enterica subsp. indica]